MLTCSSKISPCKISAVVFPFLYFRFITCSSLCFATTHILHLLAMIDAFAINGIGCEAALLCQLQIIKINIVSIYHLDTLLHDETEIDSSISSQDKYEENEGSRMKTFIVR